ncbi:MAG: PAS domain-containing protein, partial [Planctomycetia bacterium]|nr:PAS domain-containing protein [Planctomycetia bacterium]
MTAFAPLEELLREALDRLQRQEQRTAAIEAALYEVKSYADSLAITPTARSAETPVSPRPKRDSSVERAPPPRTESSSAVAPGAVLESLEDVIWSISPDGQLVFFASGAVERLYGLTATQLQDRLGQWIDAVPAEDRQRLRVALARLPDVDSFTLEHRIESATGGMKWVVSRGKLVRDRDGRPVRVDGITTDITRKALTREAILTVLEGLGSTTGLDFLEQLTRCLCIAFDARAAVVVEPHAHLPSEAHTVAGCVEGCSETFTLPADVGLTAELLTGGRAFIPTQARVLSPNDPLLAKLRAEAFVAEPLVDGSGKLLGFVAISDDRGFPTATDVRAVLKALAPRAAAELVRVNEPADRRALDLRLARAEQRATNSETCLHNSAGLIASGRMVAGVAHDFNNLLAVIVGSADLIHESLPPDHPHRETADTIASTAHTAAGVTRQLLALSKPSKPTAGPLDVSAAIR